MPFFTVAVPTHNRAHFLPQVLSGLLNQSFTDFELLVADNASEDDTGDVVASFRDSRIRYVRHKTNIGGLKNWGFCVEQARGDWLVYHQDDDMMSPLFLDRCARGVQAHPDVVMYAADVAVKVDGDVDRLFGCKLYGDGLLPLAHHWHLPQPRILPGLQIAALSMFRTGFLPPAQATPTALYRKHWRTINTNRGDHFINPRIMCEGDVAYESFIGAVIRIHPDRMSAQDPVCFGKDVERRLNAQAIEYYEDKGLDWRGALKTICAEIPHYELQTWLEENAKEPAVCEEALDILQEELIRRAHGTTLTPKPDVAEIQQQLWRLGLKYQALRNEYEDYRSERRHRVVDKIARVCGWV